MNNDAPDHARRTLNGIFAVAGALIIFYLLARYMGYYIAYFPDFKH